MSFTRTLRQHPVIRFELDAQAKENVKKAAQEAVVGQVIAEVGGAVAKEMQNVTVPVMAEKEGE